MVLNYLKLTWRNIRRHKVYSLINITGLAIGMASALFIFEYVLFEWSYDTHLENLSQKYRVYNDRYQNGELIQHGTITYPMVGPFIAKDYPEIQSYTRVFPAGRTPVIQEEQVFMEDNCMIVDEYFLDFFSVDVLAGDIKSALRDYNSLAISTQVAERYFGIEDDEWSKAIGKTLEITEDRNMAKVTAVFTPFPQATHLNPEILLSYKTLIIDAGKNDQGVVMADLSQTWSDFYHYIELQEGVSEEAFEQKLVGFGEKYFGEGEISGSVEKFHLQPLEEAHLYSDFEYEIGQTNNGKAIAALLGIGIFILFIAWINYVNLTTARSLDRSKEVGIRKVLGAKRKELITQFLFESLFFNMMGFLLAVTLVQISQPYLNQWLNIPLSIFQLTQTFSTSFSSFYMLLPLIWLLGIFLSGIYPALLLSGFNPISILKGKLLRNRQGTVLRRGLVTFQFICSLLLIMATFTIYSQLSYMQETDLGINLEQKLIVNGPQLTPYDSAFAPKVRTLRNELLKIPQVQAVSTSRNLAGNRLPRFFNVTSDKKGPEQTLSLNNMNVGVGFIEMYDLEVIHGRTFMQTDYEPIFTNIDHVLLNESAAIHLGYEEPKEILNQQIQIYDLELEVVGIVKDFHQRSIRYPIEPIVFIPTYNPNYFSLSINATNWEKSISSVEAAYHSIFPGNNFSFFFLDERFEEQYLEDKRFGQIFASFAILAAFIACLGLFGLSSFNMTQRTKEIGIRKILGATVDQLLVLLTKEYIQLILLASFLATPLAYLFILNWLENYAFSIPIRMEIFAIPIVCLIFIALLTIFFQTLQTAQANPIEALRNE
ncbi:MAG: FtsX-like permease family protein [Bacteroidota bacterium]